MLRPVLVCTGPAIFVALIALGSLSELHIALQWLAICSASLGVMITMICAILDTTWSYKFDPQAPRPPNLSRDSIIDLVGDQMLLTSIFMTPIVVLHLGLLYFVGWSEEETHAKLWGLLGVPIGVVLLEPLSRGKLKSLSAVKLMRLLGRILYPLTKKLPGSPTHSPTIRECKDSIKNTSSDTPKPLTSPERPAQTTEKQEKTVLCNHQAVEKV